MPGHLSTPGSPCHSSSQEHCSVALTRRRANESLRPELSLRRCALRRRRSCRSGTLATLQLLGCQPAVCCPSSLQPGPPVRCSPGHVLAFAPSLPAALLRSASCEGCPCGQRLQPCVQRCALLDTSLPRGAPLGKAAATISAELGPTCARAVSRAPWSAARRRPAGHRACAQRASVCITQMWPGLGPCPVCALHEAAASSVALCPCADTGGPLACMVRYGECTPAR